MIWSPHCLSCYMLVCKQSCPTCRLHPQSQQSGAQVQHMLLTCSCFEFIQYQRSKGSSVHSKQIAAHNKPPESHGISV